MSDHAVLVLAGGLVHERDVSLRSGRRVAEALRGAGVEVTERDVDAGPARVAARRPADVRGPDAARRDRRGRRDPRDPRAALASRTSARPPSACRAAFDKPVAKTVVTRAGLHTPESVCLPHETFRELGAADVMAALVERLGLPLMVKPARSGSALGLRRGRDGRRAAQRDGQLPSPTASVALLERFVTGTEVAVPVVDDGSGPGRCRRSGSARTAASTTTRRATPPAPPSSTSPPGSRPPWPRSAPGSRSTAHEALGLRDLSRSDLIVDDDGTVWFLEVNVAPGFTETSTVPLSVEAAGLDLGEVVASLVRAAVDRA